MTRFPSFPMRAFASTILSILCLSVIAVAKPANNPAFPDVKIKNFGQMDDRFYRGAQPREEDFKALAALGIKTVIDLQAETKGYEKSTVEALGMRYVNIPMIEKKYPSDAQVATFLKVVDDPNTGKFYVHCAGGRHRTGVMGAVYRFNKYHWNYDQVYKEMKDFDFYTRWGHGDFKKFVEDYWQKFQANAGSANTVATVTREETN